jgi:tight adherence protein C
MSLAATIWLLSALLGISLTVIVWMLGRAIDQVPEEDRRYLDPPPVGFRLFWWLIHPIAYIVSPVMDTPRQLLMSRRLQQAGLEFQVSPAQLVGSQVVSAMVAAGFVSFVVSAFHTPVWGYALGAALLGYLYPSLWLAEQRKKRKREMQKTFPFFLDIITLCVEAGLNFTGALQQAATKGPRGLMQDELRRVVRDLRAGKPRAQALRDMAERLADPTVTAWVNTVLQAESMGMSLGPILRVQAEQKRTERFLRAEKLAMEAPVKMLFPLIVFIFPCTFIVILFPIAMKVLPMFG